MALERAAADTAAAVAFGVDRRWAACRCCSAHTALGIGIADAADTVERIAAAAVAVSADRRAAAAQVARTAAAVAGRFAVVAAAAAAVDSSTDCTVTLVVVEVVAEEAAAALASRGVHRTRTDWRSWLAGFVAVGIDWPLVLVVASWACCCRCRRSLCSMTAR